MVKVRAWLTRAWPWLLGVLLLVLCGMLAGWKLAGLLGMGLAGGGVAKHSGEAQAERDREGRRLEQERQDLEEQAAETDGMIHDYYQHRGGGSRR